MEKAILITLLCVFCVLCLIFYHNTLEGVIFHRNLSNDFSKNKTDILKGIAILGVFISHVATHTYYGAVSAETCGLVMKLVLYSLTCLGSVCVGVFFFLSGYGNYLSVNKLETEENEKKIYVKWVVKRIKKIIVTFFVCFLIVVIINNCILKAGLSTSMLIENAFKFKMPGTTTWYLKVQLFFYIITFLTLFTGNGRYLTFVILIFSIAYSIIAYYLGLANFWWNTALCYSIGILWASNQEYIQRKLKCRKKRWICGSLIMFCFAYLVGCILNQSYIYQMVGFSVVTICIAILTYLTPINLNRIFKIEKLGGSSLELYLVHIGLVTYCFPNNHVTFTELVLYIGLTIIGTVLARCVNRRIYKLIRV